MATSLAHSSQRPGFALPCIRM